MADEIPHALSLEDRGIIDGVQQLERRRLVSSLSGRPPNCAAGRVAVTDPDHDVASTERRMGVSGYHDHGVSG